jgi:hypothetical protein
MPWLGWQSVRSENAGHMRSIRPSCFWAARGSLASRQRTISDFAAVSAAHDHVHSPRRRFETHGTPTKRDSPPPRPTARSATVLQLISRETAVRPMPACSSPRTCPAPLVACGTYPRSVPATSLDVPSRAPHRVVNTLSGSSTRNDDPFCVTGVYREEIMRARAFSSSRYRLSPCSWSERSRRRAAGRRRPGRAAGDRTAFGKNSRRFSGSTGIGLTALEAAPRWAGRLSNTTSRRGSPHRRAPRARPSDVPAGAAGAEAQSGGAAAVRKKRDGRRRRSISIQIRAVIGDFLGAMGR